LSVTAFLALEPQAAVDYVARSLAALKGVRITPIGSNTLSVTWTHDTLGEFLLLSRMPHSGTAEEEVRIDVRPVEGGSEIDVNGLANDAIAGTIQRLF
jgi:hypothetical protein